MATRPTTTIVLLTRQMMVRADFTSANVLAGIWNQPRPDVQDWATLVEIALNLGPKPGKKVVILSSDFWTQTLMLPNIASTSMAPDELASALNFEAESFSGQSAFESTIGVHALPPGQGYWIVQARTADFEQASEIVARAGSRLAGLGHPGGVPVALGDDAKSAQRWARMEFWPDAVMLVRRETGGAFPVQVLNSDPQLGRWKPEWAAWSQDLTATELETLAGPAMAPPSVSAVRSITLNDEASLTRWLSAWAECLNSKSAGIPLIRPARKPMSVGLSVGIGLLLGVLVLVGCGALHFWLAGVLRSSQDELKHHQEHTKEIADIKKQMDDIRAKQVDLQTQIKNLETSLKVMGTHRHRLGKLLTALREIHPEDLYIEKIDADAGDPRLRGHCLRPELADQFANRLANALMDQGWEVQTPKKEALKVAANGGPWSFDIQFKSAKEMTLDTRIDPKKGKGKS